MQSCMEKLYLWFKTPLGERLLQTEKELIQQILPDLFGFHLLQIGCIGDGELLDSSRILHRCVLSPNLPQITLNYSFVYAQIDASLPIAQESVDVVLLPHVLEFSHNPQQILFEVERILIAHGYLIIIGFNPLSVWGLWHRFSRQQQAPWCSKFLPLIQVKDWLYEFNFDKIQQHSLFFAPPLHRKYLPTKYLDNLALQWTKDFGAVYVLVVQKNVINLTPIKPKWLSDNRLPNSSIVKPSLEKNYLNNDAKFD
jgi:SAM-dependent methyltransferase